MSIIKQDYGEIGGKVNQAEFIGEYSSYTFNKDYACVTLTTWANDGTNYASRAKIDGNAPDVADVRSFGGLYISTGVFINVKSGSVLTTSPSTTFLMYGASY